MSIDGFYEHEPLPSPNSVVIPDNLAELDRLERLGWADSFRSLHGEIQRIELLGTDDKSRQSFHETYTEAGSRCVLFVAVNYEGVGRTFRVITNDNASIGTDGARQLVIREFWVAHAYEGIGRIQSELIMPKNGRSWSPQESTGPILFKRANSVQVSYHNKKTALPFEEQNPELLYMMNQGSMAEELTGILRGLTKVTLENSFSIEYIRRKVS